MRVETIVIFIVTPITKEKPYSEFILKLRGNFLSRIFPTGKY